MKTDELLQLIVTTGLMMDETTDGSLKVEITLNVGGMLISGRVITAKEFLLQNPLTDKISEVDDQFLHEAESQSEDSLKDGPNFIHLSDARFFVPGQENPFPPWGYPGTFWRGRIADVSGFFMGLIGAQESFE